jgi:type I restriction enzyme S subunit
MNPSPEGAAQSWRTVKLSDVCVSASKVNPKDDPEKEITYLDIGGIDNETLKITETKTFIGAEAPSRARQLVKDGDVLFSTVRTYLKKIAQVPEHFDGAIASTGFTVLRGSDVLDPKYLFYYVTQDAFIKPLSKIQRGTSYPAVRDSDVLAQLIQLAPLPEQRRIVARIEELFSRLDAGVAALRHAKAQLQRYRQSVLAAAVTGQLTQAWREQHPETEHAEELLERILEQRREQWSGRGKYTEAISAEPLNLDLPATWTITNIDSVISGIEAGKNFKCEERPPTEGETGLVKISAVTWGRFDELESKTVTRGDQIREEHVIHSGDFLLSRANTLELVGAPVIVDQITRHLMLSDKVLRLRFIERLERFALFWLRSKLGRKEIESRATGNQLSMRNIAQASLRAIPLPLPPLAEQHQIVAEVEARTTAIDHLEAELDRQITRASRLRQAILANAFSGEGAFV